MTVQLSSCEKGPGNRDWPGIITHDITNISPKGAVFNGEIISRGDQDIVSYGFVWSVYQSPTLNNSEKVVFPGKMKLGKFSAEISTTLKQGTIYCVKSFVQTTDYTIYGELVTFMSLGSQAPVITSISPATGKWGDTIRISGSHFSYFNQNNVILFGTIQAKTISSTDTLIITTVPSVINSGVVQVSVSIFGNKAVAPSAFAYLKPVINSISPLTGTFDDIITIRGSYFSVQKENITVKFDKYPAQIIEASTTSLTVKAPAEISQKNNPITVSVNQLLSNSNISFTVEPPSIYSIQSVTGSSGDEITITGNNFNPRTSGDSVLFNGNTAVVKSAAKNMIIATVPQGVYGTRTFPIEVWVAGSKAISAETFTLKDTWLRKADIPHRNYRYGATAFSIDGYGYVGLGYGITGSNFWKYNSQANKWSEIAPFPGSDRLRAASFVIGNKAYVGLGGINLHDFWRYDPVSNAWTRISDFPANNIRIVSLSANGKGYVITGESSSNFWEYDAVSDSWTKKKDFPISTSSYPFYPDACFTINSRIYVYATDRSTGPDQLWEYDFYTDAWTRKADLVNSYLDIYTTAFSINGKGYIRGNSYLFEYDPILNSFRTLPQKNNVPGIFYFRQYSIAFQINNMIYFGTSYDGWGSGPYLYDLWESNLLFE
jgi:hypothetical protein